MRLIAAILSLSVLLPLQANLISNGDFENGNTDFYTEYAHSPGNLYWIGYDVVPNPNMDHGMAAPYYDHTLGTPEGRMLAVNGADRADDIVWQQTIPVLPDNNYEFSLWYSVWYPSVSLNQVLFNGTPLLTFDASDSYASWTQASTFWHSGLSDSLTISIVNLDEKLIGNDFALDDISLNLELLLTRQSLPTFPAVPDGGQTLMLLAASVVSLAAVRALKRA